MPSHTLQLKQPSGDHLRTDTSGTVLDQTWDAAARVEAASPPAMSSAAASASASVAIAPAESTYASGQSADWARKLGTTLEDTVLGQKNRKVLVVPPER